MNRTLVSLSWILLLAPAALRAGLVPVGPPDHVGGSARYIEDLSGLVLGISGANDFGTYSYGGGTGTVTGYPFPSVSAAVSGSEEYHGYGAGARLSYGYRVDGPGSGLVPISISYRLAVSASPGHGFDPRVGAGAQGLASLVVTSADTASLSLNLNCLRNESGKGDFCSGPTSEGGVFQTHALVGSIYIVDMTVSASEGESGSASAFVDPFIQVDPSFPNGNLYTITVSDGVVNAAAPSGAAVPEPASFALLGLGLAGFAVLKNRSLRARFRSREKSNMG